MDRTMTLFRLLGTAPAVELGGLYQKIGPTQSIWRVARLVRHAPLPHVKLTCVDAPTQITISVATLMDPRFFLPVQT
jgi:hypothetical protein